MINKKEERIWEKAFANKKTAKDFAGRKIKKNNYCGNSDDKNCWNIDHTIPESLKKIFGEEVINGDQNKMPVHNKTNSEKANDLYFKANNKYFEVDTKNIKINRINKKTYRKKKEEENMLNSIKLEIQKLIPFYTYKKDGKDYDIADQLINLELEIKEWKENNSWNDDQPVYFKFVKNLKIISSNKFAIKWKNWKEKTQAMPVNENLSILISSNKRPSQIMRRYNKGTKTKDIYIDGKKTLENILKENNLLVKNNKTELEVKKQESLNLNSKTQELLQDIFIHNKHFFTLELNKIQLLESKNKNVIQEIILKIKKINSNFTFNIENTFEINNSLFLTFEISEFDTIIENLEINDIENNFYFWDYNFTFNENYEKTFNQLQDIFESIFKIDNSKITKDYWNNSNIRRKRVNNEQSK